MEFLNYYLKIESFPILILTIILLVIALLHFYWMLGGKWGFEQSLPIKTNGEFLFIPGKLASGLVGVALTGMVYFVFLKIQNQESDIWLYQYGVYLLGTIFFLRAIGDFKYVGFFKKIKDTSFAKNDTYYYSPLCLLIGILFFWIG